MVVPPKLMDDGKEFGMRVKDGPIPRGGMVKRNKVISPWWVGGILLFLLSTNVDYARHWDDSDMPLNSKCSQMDEGITSLRSDWVL